MQPIARQLAASDSEAERRLDRLEAELADLTAQVAQMRGRRRPRRLGPARAMVVAIAAAVSSAAMQSGAQARAPFQVVGDKGKPILTVTDGTDYGVFLHDDAGNRLISIGE